MTNPAEPAAYLIDADQFARLRAISSRLHAGTDRERDEGHKLWLVLNAVRDLGAISEAEWSALADTRAGGWPIKEEPR
jgi:PHD/YefM family antitoxin component YafN of YafNO toxin-antitoxin module